MKKNLFVTAAEAETDAKVIQCFESGVVLAAGSKWELDVPTTFQWMPGGVHTINARYDGKPIQLTVAADANTAKVVQASYDHWTAIRPKQNPFGCVEHKEQEAALRLPKDVAAFQWKTEPEPGIYCTALPTADGAKLVNGGMFSSWSPTFSSDAEYDKAKEIKGCLVFPKGVRGSKENPAKVLGCGFSVGSLTNKPAFRDISPVRASEMAALEEEALTVMASGTSEGVKKSWAVRHHENRGYGDSDEIRNHWARHSSGETETHPDKSHITEPGQRIVTTAYRQVKGAAKQYPYSGGKVYESFVGKDGALKARPLYEAGPDRRSERLAKEDAIGHAKERNLPFHEGVRLGHVFDASYGEKQERALNKHREEIYNKGSEELTNDPISIYAKLVPSDDEVRNLYAKLAEPEDPTQTFYDRIISGANGQPADRT